MGKHTNKLTFILHTHLFIIMSEISELHNLKLPREKITLSSNFTVDYEFCILKNHYSHVVFLKNTEIC